jgi:RNA polymerase subunit RPABC4/transcription elongation factor Spt4
MTATTQQETPSLEEVHCPGCGTRFDDAADRCPECGADHISAEELGDLLDTAEKQYDWGIGGLEFTLVLLPIVVWRQTRIENAQRELVRYRTQFDAPDGRYRCHRCGYELGQGDTSCPDCGLENVFAAIDSLELTVHDPSEYDSDRTHRWWVGPVLPLLSLPVVLVLAVLGSSGLGVSFLFVIGVPAALLGVLDRQYVRAHGTWCPSYSLLLGMLLPFFNVGLATYYFMKRRQALEWDEHF